MLQLRNTLISSNPFSEKFKRWNRSSDYCSWDGVTCVNGRVTGLNLSNEKIHGDIENSSLFSLQNLKSLDLSYNYFESNIPRRIGNLTNLTYLNLSNAGFVGQIPQEISDCKRLVTLDLSIIPFHGRGALELKRPNLRMLVQNLSELEKLYLDSVIISASGGEWCQALSSSLPNLRELSLSNCYLSGPLDPSLVKLQSLSMIHLDDNYLFTEVPRSFANFTNLTSLRLSSCGLYGTFPEEILQVPTLQNIDVSYNRLLSGSLPEFPQNNVLQRLVLRYTNFSGMLPTSIDNLWNLSILDLSNCQFYGPFPNSVDNLTQLVYLDLSVNKFNGTVPSFKLSKKLTKMDLSRNSLTGPISSVHWGGLLKLVALDLGNNLLNGSIPPSLFTIPSLEKIQLPQNQFRHLPEMSNASSSVLDTLDLSCNNLEGPIPTSIFNLQKVSILSLSSNKLNGTVHLDNIQGLRNVTYLDLSYNNLYVKTGGNHSLASVFPKIETLVLASCQMKAIPDLKNLPWIDYFYMDLSNNRISGTVPNWIWKVGDGALYHLNLSQNHLVGLQEPYFIHTLLTVLDLHQNQLQGKFPMLPKSASYVDLSSNNLTSIPPEIGDILSFTLFFSLANNSLTEAIPESICRARQLQVLDLSMNHLSGKIPQCITSSMSQALGVLNLQSNNLSGVVPDLFPVNCKLRTLDLSRNMLNGHIPRSLAKCSELEVLNLGHNRMIDEFPCFLNSTRLQILVLRSNRFHGPIRCPKEDSTWAMLQIFDLAQNNFSGAIPRAFLRKWQAMIDFRPKFNQLLYKLSVLGPLFYYPDAVSITSKGSEMELHKILAIFTCIDLSSNNLHGPIPEELSRFKSLWALNLSNNALTGQIPSSLQNLRQIESLDLSRNNLSGAIPNSLEELTFLSRLNMSFNQLVGRIPHGNQFQTFSEDSFLGNEGLCGLPLNKNCSDQAENEVKKRSKAEDSDGGRDINWTLISAEVGFIVGFGIAVGSLVLNERWRHWYFRSLDGVAFKLCFSQKRLTIPLGFVSRFLK